MVDENSVDLNFLFINFTSLIQVNSNLVSLKIKFGNRKANN
jgi:hypothetical protein